jgi:DnaJ-class molecular chaperone
VRYVSLIAYFAFLQAYRKLSLKYHPDRNADAGATAIFQRITAAKDILLDAEAKQAFQNLQRYVVLRP